MDITNILDKVKNEAVHKAILKANSIIPWYDKIMVSVSGGSDSDIIMDIVQRVKNDSQNIDYVFFDTGLEYEATKRHLDYLENRYSVPIKRVKAIKSIPLSCKKYGQPFLSKYVSNQIYSLQINGFKFEDKPYEELIKEYPKCKSRIKWWCDKYEASQFSIRNLRFLKEFLISNPPKFKISQKCCVYSKKMVSKNLVLENNYDLIVLGIRKSEGGARAFKYKTCFTGNESSTGIPKFFPMFWMSDADKKYYNEFFDIVNSDCYTKYGLSRTGCVGCPFGRNFLLEIEIASKNEPKLAKACNNVFDDSYEYTRQYRQFKKEMSARDKAIKDGYTTLLL